MRPAVVVSALTLGLLLALGAGSASAGNHVSLVPAGSSKFPQRSYRLTVPERRGLRVQDIKVTENGEPVSKLSLTSTEGAAPGEFGTILVIDASKSMHGRAIRSAVGAALELARQRAASQQLGIITFNKTATVLLAPTSDQRAIEDTLSTIPRLDPQTRMFDAVSSALDELEKANIEAGSIVVLSDGADTGSLAPPDAVARRARAANVSVYSVGLRSRAFDTSGLKELASTSRGRYIAAESVTDVRRIFRDLGTQLSSEYLVSYRSFARPGRDVIVAARVGDGLGTASYRVPGGATFVQIEPGIWTSGYAVAAVGGLCALLLAFALAMVLLRRGRAPSLRERVRGFVSEPLAPSVAPDAVLTGHTPGAAERSLARTRWWHTFKYDLEIARITTDPTRIVAIAALSTLVLMYLLVSITGILIVGLFALAIPLGVRAWVHMKRDRQRKLFVEQLPDLLQESASAIRAGHGLVAALSMVAEDAPEPARAEFRRVIADEALGVPLDEALRVVERRMASRDIMQIALVAEIQRESGGNTAEVIDRITDSLRRSSELRRMVQALTAQGRLSRWVVTALPPALLLAMSVLNPDYIKPLFTEALGLVLLALAGLMMAAGSLVIGKIVNFDV
jgi:tight adherence protein B